MRRKHAASLPFPAAALHFTPCPGTDSPVGAKGPCRNGEVRVAVPLLALQPPAWHPLPSLPAPLLWPSSTSLPRCLGQPPSLPAFALADGTACACLSPAAPAKPGKGSFFSAFASFLSNLQIILPLCSKAPDPSPGFPGRICVCSAVANGPGGPGLVT